MKKIAGLMFLVIALALVSAPAFAQPVVAAPAAAAPVATPAVAATPTTATPVVTTPAAAAPATVMPAAVTPAIASQAATPPRRAARPQVAPAAAPASPAPLARPASPAPPAPPAAPAAAPIAAAAPAAPPEPPEPGQAPPAQKPPATPKPVQAPAAPPPPELPGRERIDPDPVNVRFEVTISYQVGTAAPIKRTAVLTVANNTGRDLNSASLRSGNNVPVPTTTFPLIAPKAEEGKEPSGPRQPMTSFQYRSVGMNVDVERAAVVPGNRVRATLNVEFSGVDEKATSAPAPSFATFSQRIALYFDNGKPVLVAQSSDVVDNVERRQMVEVKATILR